MHAGQGIDQLSTIELDVYGAAVTFCDNVDPQTELQAKFSLQHCVALVLARGKPRLEDFQPPQIFDDGLAQSFWLQEEEGRKCCAFMGEPHISPTYFGQGLAIAVSQNNAALAEAMNFALRSINDKGIFAELYLRYFPISLY